MHEVYTKRDGATLRHCDGGFAVWTTAGGERGVFIRLAAINWDIWM